MMDQWLIRSAKNLITGPFTGDHIRQLIREKKLGPWDEVCSANRFWFFVREAAEVREQLGILPPVFSSADEELTQTDTTHAPKTVTATEVPGETEPPIPELPEVALDDGDTAMIQNRAFKQVAPQKKETPEKTPKIKPAQKARSFKIHAPFTISTIERQSIWRGIAWGLIIITVFLAIVLFQVLKNQ